MKWTKGFFAQAPEELEQKINDFFQESGNGITEIHYDCIDSGELGIYYTAIIQYSTSKSFYPVKVFVAESPDQLEGLINYYIVDHRAEIDVSSYATAFKKDQFVFSYIASFSKQG